MASGGGASSQIHGGEADAGPGAGPAGRKSGSVGSWRWRDL